MLLTKFKLETDGNDWKPAFLRAIAVSQAYGDEEIRLPTGVLKCSGPIEFSTGTVLIGSGGCGSNLGKGSVLMADFDGDLPFLTWNGKTSYHGTGGGLERVIIAKGKNRTGGIGVLLTGDSPSNRCGWFDLNRVFVYSGSDAGQFDIGLKIDGSKINVAGSAGIRDITFRALMIAGASKRAMEIINGVHIHGSLQTAPANFNGDVLIDGKSEDVQIGGRIYGTLTLGDCKEVIISGEASTINILPTATKYSILRKF